MNATKLGPILARAVGAHISFSTYSWGDAPRWDEAGPLALNLRAGFSALNFRAVVDGDSESANGAPPSQPGATPQVKGRKQNEG